MKKKNSLFFSLFLFLSLSSFLSANLFAGEEDTSPPNPYELAEKALHAYQMKDIVLYETLLFRPFPKGTSLAKAFPHPVKLMGIQKPKGLYLLAEEKIAAVLTSVPEEPRAIWFEIVRKKEGGFAIKQLIISGKNPPMNLEFEGNPP